MEIETDDNKTKVLPIIWKLNLKYSITKTILNHLGMFVEIRWPQ